MSTATCELCEKKYAPRMWNNKYCSSDCRNLCMKLRYARELFRLTDEEKKLREKILKKWKS